MVLLLIGVALSASCSTILDKETYTMKVTTNLAPAQVKVYDQVYSLPAEVEITRSNKDLNMILIGDSLNIDYTLKSRLTPKFMYFNLVGQLAAPINYIVDLTNPKRFYYGNEVHLNSEDTIRTYERPFVLKYRRFFGKEFRKNKGDVFFRIAIPALNSFVMKPTEEPIHHSTGLMGISLGFDFYYKTNLYISTSVAYVTSTAPFLFYDRDDYIESAYWSLSNNHQWNRFHFGYGLSFSHNIWKYNNGSVDIDSTSPDYVEIKKSNNALGLVFPASFQLNKYFSFGLVYRPSLYRFGSDQKFEYEHLISFEAILKLPVRRSKSITNN